MNSHKLNGRVLWTIGRCIGAIVWFDRILVLWGRFMVQNPAGHIMVQRCWISPSRQEASLQSRAKTAHDHLLGGFIALNWISFGKISLFTINYLLWRISSTGSPETEDLFGPSVEDFFLWTKGQLMVPKWAEMRERVTKCKVAMKTAHNLTTDIPLQPFSCLLWVAFCRRIARTRNLVIDTGF